MEGHGKRSKQLDRLIASRPDVFTGYYDELDNSNYEVWLNMGYNYDGLHSLYGRIQDILKDVKYIEKCNNHNCNTEDCIELRNKGENNELQ